MVADTEMAEGEMTETGREIGIEIENETGTEIGNETGTETETERGMIEIGALGMMEIEIEGTRGTEETGVTEGIVTGQSASPLLHFILLYSFLSKTHAYSCVTAIA